MQILAIAQYEWIRLKRNRILIGLCVLFATCLILLSFTHFSLSQSAKEAQQNWQATTDEHWKAQPDRHPHRVAHYGHVVFRPHSPLSFFDPGVSPYTGNFLYLEAHKQNSSAINSYPINASTLALGIPSVSGFFWVVWPLVLLVLAYASMSDDKQMGRALWFQSLGANHIQLMLGKSLVYIVLSLVVIALLGISALLFLSLVDALSTDNILSAALILSAYVMYATIWTFLLVGISNLYRRNLPSLLTGVAAWFLFVVLVPKMAAPVAESLAPMKNRANLESLIVKSVKEVGDSHNPNDPYFNEFKKGILDQYGVSKVEDLPVNWNGLVMAQGEKITSEIYHMYMENVHATFDTQQGVHYALGYLSPTLVASQLSALLSRNDQASMQHFADAAENFRFELIQSLNGLHTHEIEQAHDRDQKISAEVWQEMTLFDYNPPALFGLSNPIKHHDNMHEHSDHGHHQHLNDGHVHSSHHHGFDALIKLFLSLLLWTLISFVFFFISGKRFR